MPRHSTCRMLLSLTSPQALEALRNFTTLNPRSSKNSRQTPINQPPYSRPMTNLPTARLWAVQVISLCRLSDNSSVLPHPPSFPTGIRSTRMAKSLVLCLLRIQTLTRIIRLLDQVLKGLSTIWWLKQVVGALSLMCAAGV